MAALRRDFPVDSFVREMEAAGVGGAVAVQARQNVEETEWLLATASATPQILGVVGWVPLREPNLPEQLERLGASSLLRGVRHVVQAEAAGFLEDSRFHAGVSLLRETGLVYDILIHADQLAEATRFVDRHPLQSFVLDHLAKPRIREGLLEPWRQQLQELARRTNVSCKLSGLVTEADPRAWSIDTLTPYMDTALRAFGPERLMTGSDWPVLTIGSSYSQWWQLVTEWTGQLSAEEQSSILGGTARKVYRLERKPL